MSAVTAIVVNYNAGPHLAECVRSLRADGVDDVVVVDNGSVDGSLDALAAADADARVIRTGRNLGYGTAVNLGGANAASSYLLVLNADVVVDAGTVKTLVAALEADPKLAIVGPRIEEVDGEVYPSARAFPSLVDAAGHAFLGLVRSDNRFTRRYRRHDIDLSTASRVDWVSGACFLVRRDAFEQLEGFDPGYFMYAEDVDLCWRAGRAGWSVGYEPAARVTHVQGVSTAGAPYRMILEHHRSTLRFFARTASGPSRLLIPFAAVALAVRLLAAWALRALRSGRGRR